MASPFFCKGSDLPLERPGVAGLLIELPIGLGNGGRPHQPARIEIGERRLALAFLDPPANPGSVDPGIDHQMRNVDVLRAELARRALRHGAQSEFGAGKSGVTGATAQARSGSSKEDVAAVPRNHQTRRLPPGEETGEHAISQTLRNTRSVVSISGKLTFAPMLKMHTSSGALVSASCRKAATSSSLRASSERPTMCPRAASTSATSGASLSPWRRPAKTANPSAANFLAIAVPIKSPAPITAAEAFLGSNVASSMRVEVSSG